MGKLSIKFKSFFLPSNDIANCIALDLNTIIIFLRVFHLYRAASMLGVMPLTFFIDFFFGDPVGSICGRGLEWMVLIVLQKLLATQCHLHVPCS